MKMNSEMPFGGFLKIKNDIMEKKLLVPVKKILRMINECQDQEQIDNCRLVVQNYVKSAKKQGVINIEDLKNRLTDELAQRQEALYLVKIFNSNI